MATRYQSIVRVQIGNENNYDFFSFCFFFWRRLRLTQIWLGACQSSEYVRCMILVMRVLQQSLPLVRSRTVSYFRASWLWNGIGVHGFVHRIGKVALVILTGECGRLVSITAIHGIREHDFHIVREPGMRKWLSYAMFL